MAIADILAGSIGDGDCPLTGIDASRAVAPSRERICFNGAPGYLGELESILSETRTTPFLWASLHRRSHEQPAIRSCDGQLAEIELSKIAQNNSTNPMVINFAKATVRDETHADRTLRELAEKKGIPVSEASDAEHGAMVKILRSKNELDDYCAKDMARTDDKLIQLYQSASADSDRDLGNCGALMPRPARATSTALV